jgi:MFS family permease
MMNTGSAAAAIVSPLLGGWMIDTTGNWEMPFIVSMALMLLGSVTAFAMKPGKQFDETPQTVPVGAQAAV